MAGMRTKLTSAGTPRAGVETHVGQRRGERAVDRAMELGLLVAVKNEGYKGFSLRSVAAVKAA